MSEVTKAGSKTGLPESYQKDDLSKRAGELLECAEEIEILVRQIPTDILHTQEGTDFFEAASTLVDSLKQKASIIKRDIVPGKKD